MPAKTPGFRVERDIDKMGMRTAPMGELVFENCELPAEALLGREGRGSKIFNAALEWERGAILSPSLGAMKRQVDQCIAYARKREQFGKPISKFQSVSNRIVDMMVRLETSRMLIYKYAGKKCQGKDASFEASMAKLHVTESFLANSLDAIRIFGAQGYTVETGLERDLQRRGRRPDLLRYQRHPAQHSGPAVTPLRPEDDSKPQSPGVKAGRSASVPRPAWKMPRYRRRPRLQNGASGANPGPS